MLLNIGIFALYFVERNGGDVVQILYDSECGEESSLLQLSTSSFRLMLLFDNASMEYMMRQLSLFACAYEPFL